MQLPIPSLATDLRFLCHAPLWNRHPILSASRSRLFDPSGSQFFLKLSGLLFVRTIATFTLFSNSHHSTFCLRSEYTIPRRKRLKSFRHQKNSSPQRINSGYHVPRPQSVSCTLCSTKPLATTKQEIVRHQWLPFSPIQHK